jgi:penicillin-binding protein 2
VVLEAGAWGAKDSGPIARKILDQWVVNEGGERPVDPTAADYAADVPGGVAPPGEAPAKQAQPAAPTGTAPASTEPPEDNAEDQQQ